MTIKTLTSLFLFTVLSSFYSCSGQQKASMKEVPFLAVGQLVSEIDNQIWDVFQDHNDNYWFGSNGSGLFFYDGKVLKNYTEDDGLIDNTIRGIQEDKFGNILIETPSGVSKYDGKYFKTLELLRSPLFEWRLHPDDLWFNCNGNANDVYLYDGEKLMELMLPKKDLKKAFGLYVRGLGFEGMNSSPYSVFGIDKDSNGNIWIGTVVAGAFRYDGTSFLWVPEKELSTLPDGRVPGVRSMLEDKDGNMWLSNFISKYKITKSDSIVTYEKLEGVDMSEGHFENRLPYFNSGLSDTNGDLWMTTYGGGVWKYDGNKLINFPVKDGDTDVLLISIYEANDGVLWLGSDNAGAYKFNGEEFEKFVPEF